MLFDRLEEKPEIGRVSMHKTRANEETKPAGSLWMKMGLLLLIAAFLLICYNIWDDRRADIAAQKALVQLEQTLQTAHPLVDYRLNPDMEMPVQWIDGEAYIGVLTIPALDLTLPVISQWSYPGLKKAPCRYQGSAYNDTLIIAGHNYRTHFYGLKNLNNGDEILFTDYDGNHFLYRVTAVEVLAATAIEEMQSGDWDLTLFTCTYGGQSRVTVRCTSTDSDSNQIAKPINTY